MLAVTLVAVLSVVVAVPVGAGTSAIYGAPITVPQGGTSAGAAALYFSETSPNEFLGGSFTVDVSIYDANHAGTLSFVETSPPTLNKPQSLVATVAWSGTNSFKVTATSSNTSQVESFIVGNLRVKATGAALGPIIVEYSSSLGPIFGAKITASGWLAAQANSGASNLSVNLDSGSPQFATGAGAGNIYINTGGGSAENKPVGTVTPGTPTTVGLSSPVSYGHNPGERVSQEQTISNRLPSIGAIPGTATGLSITASYTPSVVRSGASQAAGNVVISETAGHPLAATQVIHFAVANDTGLGTPGATFSATPQVSANTISSGITASIQNATATGFDLVIGTAASGSTGGVLTISNIKLTVASNATLGNLPLTILSYNAGQPINQVLTVAVVVASAPLTLSLTPSTTTPADNGVVTLYAQTSVAAAGLNISFQAKPAGSPAFTTVGSAYTTASGTASLSVMASMNTLYQAVFAGNASYNAAQSGVVAVSPVRTLGLLIAAGYKTSLTSGYSSAVSVANGSYVTLKGTLGGPSNAGASIKFYQRIGKSGIWTFLSSGSTNASGIIIWSKAVKVPSSATGYDRYVYFKVVVDGTALYGQSVSSGVRAVAKPG